MAEAPVSCRVLVRATSALFAILPIAPVVFVAVAVPLGVVAFFRTRLQRGLVAAGVSFAILGASAHVAAVMTGDGVFPDEAYRQLITGGVTGDRDTRVGDNLLSQYGLAGLRAWNRVDGGNSDAVVTRDGLWSLPRVNAASGRQNDALYAHGRVPLRAELYTLSFDVRHDGTHAAFNVVFWTHTRQVRVPQSVEGEVDGIRRVHATFDSRPDDVELIRLIELDRLEGDWSVLTIGRVKLEEGSAATPFSITLSDRARTPWRGLLWWFGIASLVVFAVYGARWLFTVVPQQRVSMAVLGGLLVHVLIGVTEVTGLLSMLPEVTGALSRLGVSSAGRASGLAGHPNLLGHTMLANAMLVWVLAGCRTSLLAIGVAFVGILSSGSRTAFVGWLLLSFTFAVAIPRRTARWLVLPLVIALGTLVVFTPDLSGRLSTTFDAQSPNLVQRYEAWAVLWQAFRSSPVVGIGTYQTEPYIGLARLERSGLAHVSHAHNVVLHALVEAGLMGLAAHVMLLLALVRSLVMCRHRRGLVMVAILLATNLTDLTLFAAGVLVPLVVAAAWCSTSQDGQPRGATTSPC